MSFILWTAALFASYVFLYVAVFRFDLPKTVLMQRRLDRMRAKVEVLDAHIDLCEEALVTVEDRNDYVYRSLYGLDRERDRSVRVVTSPAGSDVELLESRLDSLFKRVYEQSVSLDEIIRANAQAGEMRHCLPAIPPILPAPGSYHLSSRFGYRVDPVYGGAEGHTGIDLATRKGNPVYVTGDGVVVEAVLNVGGYGRCVIVDHGFGYKTRYAHLSKMDVHEGQRLRRGQMIGAVGSTGKSTGPHLHYEVIYRGAPINPLNFMDLDMPLQEYKDILSAAREGSKK